MKAQNWLDQNYPREERDKITKLIIRDKNLEGDLDLSDFVNCQILNCLNNKITSLNLSNCLKLKKLNCSFNKLTNLYLDNLTQLQRIDCDNNYLNSFDYSVLNPEKLIYLCINSNNLPKQDLSVFSQFTNLEVLWIGNENKEHLQQNIYNKFTGSLNYLSNLKQLRELYISNTDLNEVDVNKLPPNLEYIIYSTTGRPTCKLTEIVPLLKKRNYYGRCCQCQQINTSKDWCQPCKIKEWQADLKELTGQQLIDKFIQKQPNYRKIKWIPYEQFTNIEYLNKGGFSKIYKAKWDKCQDTLNDGGIVVLKTLNNSQNITIGFLTEIANTKLVDFDSVKCYGISQDPTTKNYLMVMEYIEGGNLRDYLKNNVSELSWWDKLAKLSSVAWGLKDIHLQGLIHRDFHAGNILIKVDGDYFSSFITDLGLSQPANSQSQVGEIFGVIPYIAPEVLKGQPYTKSSDIYSFGIIAYEMCSGLPPYYNIPHDISLILRICQEGLRPQFQIKIPQLLENLIKRCWDTDHLKRPSAGELYETLEDWENEIIFEKDTKFTRQLQAAEQHNQTLSDAIRFPKYEIHREACYHSKSINTQQITQLLQQKVSEEYHTKALEELTLDNFNLEDIETEQIVTNLPQQLAQAREKINYILRDYQQQINYWKGKYNHEVAERKKIEKERNDLQVEKEQLIAQIQVPPKGNN